MAFEVLGGGDVSTSPPGVTFHSTSGPPTTVAAFGILSFDIYGDSYRQIAVPSGADWRLEKKAQGAVRVCWAHSDSLSWNRKAPLIRVGGTTPTDGTLLVSGANPTNLAADPSDTIGVDNGDLLTAGDGLYTVTFGADNSACQFTAIEVPHACRVIGLFPFVRTTNSNTLRVKASLYTTTRGYHRQEQPWQLAWSGAKWNHAAAAVTGQNLLSWDVAGHPGDIEAGKYYVRAYWNNSGSIEMFARHLVDGQDGMKGDRLLANAGIGAGANADTYGGTFAAPNFANLYPDDDYTSGVTNNAGAPSASNRACVDWALVTVPRAA